MQCENCLEKLVTVLFSLFFDSFWNKTKTTYNNKPKEKTEWQNALQLYWIHCYSLTKKTILNDTF